MVKKVEISREILSPTQSPREKRVIIEEKTRGKGPKPTPGARRGNKREDDPKRGDQARRVCSSQGFISDFYLLLLATPDPKEKKMEWECLDGWKHGR